MRTTPMSEVDARRAQLRKPMSAGWRPAKIIVSSERPSRRGNEMIELTMLVKDDGGEERTLRDWLTNSRLAALKLRHAAEAVGALAKYEAGTIEQNDFPGHDIQVFLIVEKKRGQPERNVITDYRAQPKTA